MNQDLETASTSPDLEPASQVADDLAAPASERSIAFPIVEIGASAGGLKAIEEFFDNMPADSGAAFVIIQHLSPDFKSLMSELLERRTQMDVRVATEGMPLAQNTVFLIPPGQNMHLNKHCLHLTPQERGISHQVNFPIDLFFQSSAEGKERIISIVLSGTGTDGTQGIQSVSEAGGIVLVQDPITAEFDGMPRSAIATGIVDLVLPPHALANVTYQLATSPHQRQAFRAHRDVKADNSQIQQIVGILEDRERIDFSQYKPNMLNRRIVRRSLVAGHSSLHSYIQELEKSADARATLRNDLLITVTRFFRDSAAWDFLQAEILPELIARATPDKPIRVWVTACATGEEAYSMAILLRELIEKSKRLIEAKIFATDIDHIALAKASAGVYSAAALSNLSLERRDRFFIQKGDQFEVSKSLREMIIFANHNLAQDAAFTQIDLVSCRNVLIYMEPALQQQVLRSLHFSLKLRSILFLGESENLGYLSEEFAERHRKWKIYQKLRDVRLLTKPRGLSTFTTNRLGIPFASAPSYPRFDPLLESAFTALLGSRRATCFLVDRDGQLIHLCSDALKLLKVSTGRASQDAVRMLPESLQFALNTALHRARQQETQVIYRHCTVAEPEIEIELVTLEVNQQQSADVGSYSLVIIEPERELSAIEVSEQFASEQFASGQFASGQFASEQLTSEQFASGKATGQYIVQLQQELQMTQENLQATVEELEATNEEQQSTNEELIASNEELQSTNEELHSVNEELHTVNSEYQSKIQELVQLNNDVENLLGSIDIGVVFLDSALNIRQFTPAATQAFHLRPTDVGRPLEQLAHNLEDFDLAEILVKAKNDWPDKQKVIEHRVKIKQNGPHMLLQIYPYLLEDKVRDGLVLTLINVDDIQQSQQMLAQTQADLRQANEQLEQQIRDRTQALRSSEQLLQLIAHATPNAIYVYDLIERRNIYANAFLEKLLGFSAEELQEKGNRIVDELIHPDDLEAIKEHHQAIIDSDADDGHIFRLEYRIRNAKGKWRHFYTEDIIFERSPDGRPAQILGTAVDISDRKAAALQLQESEARYRMLYKSTPIMMHSVDRSGKLISVSNRWLSVLGYEESEVIGKPVSNFLQSASDAADSLKADSSKTDKSTSSLEAPSERKASPEWMNTQGCKDLSCQLTAKNGNIIDVLLSAVAQQDDTGSLNCLLTVMVDITERKKVETELSKYRERLEELVAARANEIEQTNQRLRGEIKERHQAQSDLAQRARDLERSNDSLEEFAYVVSHDLQEPLRAMTVFSQLLEQRYQSSLDSTACGYLDNIVQGGVRMQAMIDGILDFSRITHLNEDLKPVNLQNVLENLEVTLQPVLSKNKATLTYKNMPTVMADASQIAQVFQNLISNAIKFKGDDPPIISITAELKKEDASQSDISPRKQWLIEVSDNGIGIPSDQQSRIFTLFQRLHTRQEREGYGIGLSICKKIVERHRGQIWVNSQVHKGATFCFTLDAL